jgi:Bifunctional DNA primase/polymerase, N-terminal/Primase C terminal 1 (PriCT-1)
MSTTQQSLTYSPVQGARWMAKKGLRVTPLNGKAPFLSGWQNSATTNLDQINTWYENRSDSNFGCVAKKKEFWMLDEDVAGVVDRFTTETGIKIETLRVESSAGRFHWYFKSSPESDELLDNITQDQFKDGAASVRVNNEQCVCPFSIHPEKKTQYLPVDPYAQIQEAPVEFVKWILSQRVQPASAHFETEDNQTIPDGQRDNFLTARAGKLREAGAEFDEIYSALVRENEKCVPPKDDSDLQRIAKSVCRYKKGAPYTVTIGGFLPGQNVVPSARPAQNQEPVVEVVADEVLGEESELESEQDEATDEGIGEYPYWCWNGTLYEDFATICGANNLIPKEFFLESIKTIVGAVCGHRITPFQAPSQEARFYTVFIGPGGGGKSSASKWATELFIGTGLVGSVGQTGGYMNIGVAQGTFSSASALIKNGFSKHDRILMVYDEITALIEKCAIPGSGLSYMDEINRMYESTMNAPQGIVKDDKIGSAPSRSLHLSILGCTTPERWDNGFSRSETDGSGFFQRLNIISNSSEERVAKLAEPDLTVLRDRFVKKIQPLEYQKAVVMSTPEADEMLEQWFQSKQEKWRRLPGEVTGRIQVLIHRNVSHLAWLLSGNVVVPNPEKPNEPIEVLCDEDIMEKAIALAEYELFVRPLHRPIEADNPWAKVECLIRRHMIKHGTNPVLRGKLSRAINANRYGVKMFNDAIKNLAQEGFLKVVEKAGNARGRKGEYIVLVTD